MGSLGWRGVGGLLEQKGEDAAEAVVGVQGSGGHRWEEMASVCRSLSFPSPCREAAQPERPGTEASLQVAGFTHSERKRKCGARDLGVWEWPG